MKRLKLFAVIFAIVSVFVLVSPRAATEQDSKVTVYVTKTGSKYHRSGCRSLSKSSIPISLEEAKKNYSACSVCKPPS